MPTPIPAPQRRIPNRQSGKPRAGWTRYEAAKKAWLARNPGATSEQIEDAFIVIAQRLGV